MVADAATTGARDSITEDQLDYFTRIRGMDLGIPCLIGFGISNYRTFTMACSHASGAIIGSAFIRKLGEEGSLEEKIGSFIKAVREP
jgi:tryptophan synthase alpha chain